MKLPQPAPDWHQVLRDPTFREALTRPELLKAAQRASGERYPFWDTLKYMPPPSELPPEWIWTMREMSSLATRSSVPLTNTSGAPFSFWLPDKAQEFLHRIDQNASGPVLSDNQPFHSRERYIARSLTDEAIASSQMEGAATTRDAAKSMLQTRRRPQNRSERMIANNYRAIERIRELKDEPITLERILELHVILTDGTLDDSGAAGRLRRSPVEDNTVVEDADGIVLHRPPKGAELEARLAALISFANTEDKDRFMNPVVKAIILHFWIGHDHPFIDGNGRTARALFFWHLLKQGYWLFEYLSISEVVKRTYEQYKRAYLYSEVAPACDLTYFIMYNLRVINLAVIDLNRFIARKSADLQRAALLLRDLPGLNHRQRELLADALKNPGKQYTIFAHQSTHRVSYQTARTDLFGLAEKGFLDVRRSGKTFVFLPTARIETAVRNTPSLDLGA